MDKKKQEARLNQQIRGEYRIFKRRKEGIKKKAMELATLCDIPVCLTIQSPDGEYEIWPENPKEVKTILDNYYKKKSNVFKSKKETQNLGKLSSQTGQVADAKGIKVFPCENHGLINDPAAEKDIAEFRGENRSNMGASQNLEKVSNRKNCLKGKGKAEENCYQEVTASNDLGNQSLGQLGFPEAVYDLPPLEIFYPNLQTGPEKLDENFASTSRTTHFSPCGDTIWQLPPCDEPSLWSLPINK